MNTRSTVARRLNSIKTSPSLASRMTGAVVGAFDPNGAPQIQPNFRSKTVSTPEGVPFAGQNIPEGRKLAKRVTIVLDRFTQTPTVAGFTEFKLFDAHGFLASINQDVTNPANGVYIGSTTANGYNFLINQMCRYDLVIESMLVSIEKNSTGINPADVQLNESIRIIEGDINQQYSTDELPLSDYADLDAYKQDARLIPLTGTDGLITPAKAWKVNVWNGLRVKLTCFIRARVIQ